MNIKIGEKIMHGGKQYVCQAGECERCDLIDGNRCTAFELNCCAELREDLTGVIFKEVKHE
jgi:hypothetical protein